VKGLRAASLIVSFLLLISVCAVVAQEGTIKEIVILGNERVDQGTILKEVQSKAGEGFSKERVAKDIKAIYALGFFQDVQVDVSQAKEGVVVTFVVIEKPFVTNILIEGNVKLSQQDLEGVVEVKRDAVLDMAKVRSSVEAIKKLYASKRYFGSEVEYRVDVGEKNRATVYFTVVEEGVKGYLTKIVFIGNKVFGARKLKSIMQTKEKGLTWWFTSAGNLETDVLDVDMTRIKALYYDYGYVTVKVSNPEITLSKNKKSIQVTIKIDEGEQYKLGGLDVAGDILTTKEALLKGFKSKINKVYSSSLIHKDLLWLTDQYADKGYAYVDVSPLTTLDHEKKLVQVTFNIQKGIKTFINRIEIAGNTKTRDKVIRRELKIAEGDLYNATSVRKSRERVKRTGYFKEVDFAPSPTEKKELIDLDVRVEEASMGKLEFGAGYSSFRGLVGSVGLSHGNLFGRGYSVYVKAEAGEEVLNLRLGFNDPRFFDSPYSLGFDAFKDTEEYDNYRTDILGGDVKIGREITDTIRADLMYLFESVRIYDVFTNYPPGGPAPAVPVGYQPGDYIYDHQGTETIGKLVLTFTRNTIDDPYFPRNGSNVWVSGAVAGLGGDTFFYSVSGGATWFHPVVGDLVLNLSAKAGTIQPYRDKPIPITEKFFVGGIRTLRGFEYGMAGPVDRKDEPLGALNMVLFTAEFLYPLSKSLGLRAAAFYDIGKGWGGGDRDLTTHELIDSTSEHIFPLRHAIGVGIRWYSPFGPIRVDWGYNISPRSHRGEKSNVFDFSMGAMF
jgi:outer membrane protein insertion porin family